MDIDTSQNNATGIFLLFPMPIAQKRRVAAMITVTEGNSS